MTDRCLSPTASSVWEQPQSSYPTGHLIVVAQSINLSVLYVHIRVQMISPSTVSCNERILTPKELASLSQKI
uniref:Uncharacterized protein n=1 Tax=Populus trichocarpa TaxID=3694 RepID=A9PEF6_POPTR|nr:unknown [Populus trichocarpa]